MADTDIIVSEMTPASQINTTDLMIMTQPDSQAETGYSTKSGTVLQVANKMLKGTEYSTDLPDFTDKTPLGGLEELKADIKALLPVDSASGNPCNFETGIADALVSLKASILASGGGGTPATPIPIVGHSELNLVRCGVNLFDDAYVDNNLTAEQILPAGTYYIKAFVTGSSEENRRFSFYFNDTWNVISTEGTFDDGGITWSGSTFGWLYGNATATITLTHAYKIRASVLVNTYLTRRYAIYVDNSISTFVNYNGQTFTVSFGQTVYGGVYDAKAGKVTITHRKQLLSDMEWEYRGGFFRTLSIASEVKKPESQDTLTDSKCEIFTNVTWSDVGNNNNEYAILGPVGGELIIKCSSCSDLTAWAALINGYSLVYPLATPIEIDVSALSVAAIVGTNNITSDGGGDVAVSYKDSIQHYIDSKIASVQALIL